MDIFEYKGKPMTMLSHFVKMLSFIEVITYNLKDLRYTEYKIFRLRVYKRVICSYNINSSSSSSNTSESGGSK